MDVILRKLERQARANDSAEDMYKFYVEYRRNHPSPYSNQDEISFKHQCNPRYDKIPYKLDGFLAKIEIRPWERPDLGVEITCSRDGNSNFGDLLIDLMGTTKIEGSEGPEIDLNNWTRVGHSYNAPSLHLYLTWDRERSKLSFVCSDWGNEEDSKQVVGFISLPYTAIRSYNSPIISEKYVSRLEKTFLPWVQEWWDKNYDNVIEWAKLTTEYGLLYKEEALRSKIDAIAKIKEEIAETQKKLANEAFYQMQLDSGIL